MKSLVIIISLIWSSAAIAQDSMDVRFLQLLNEHRAKNGLAPVKYSAALDSGAQFQANYMDRKRVCTHSQEPDSAYAEFYPSGLSRCRKFDSAIEKKFNQYGFRENVGGGCRYKDSKYDARLIRISGKPLGITLQTVDYWFNRWVKSPSHNAALLDPNVTHAGFGMAGGFKDNFLWYGEFACCVLAQAK